MKKLILSLSTILAIFFTTSILQAQDDERDGSSKDEKVTIKIDGKTHELGDFISDMVEKTMSNVANNIDVDFDEDSFDFSLNINGQNWEEWGENLGKEIEDMVNNMEIELTDLDPEDIEDSKFDSDWGKRSGEDLLEEIEEEYGSKVELIEKMKIKIREEKVIVDIDAKLENGKVIHKKIEEYRD